MYLDPDAPKPEEVQEMMKREHGNSAAGSSSNSVTMEARKRIKKHRYYKGGRCFKGRRTTRGSSQNDSRQSADVTPAKEKALFDVPSPVDAMNNSASSLEVKNSCHKTTIRLRAPPGISASSAKEFLNNLQNMQKSSPSKSQKLAVVTKPNKSPPKSGKKLDPNTLSPKVSYLDLDEKDDVIVVDGKEIASFIHIPSNDADLEVFGKKRVNADSSARRASKENATNNGQFKTKKGGHLG